MSTTYTEYLPDHASPPGETLLEVLETVGLSQAELAQRMKRPKKTINEIIQGKTAITAETALQLERVLDIPASFWNKREQDYREALARQVEKKRLKKWTDWLNELPIKAMIEQGWISERSDETEVVLEALKFFGVASPDAWHNVWQHTLGAFSSSPDTKSYLGAIAAWLRQGEREAQQIDCMVYDPKQFRQILIEVRSVPRSSPGILVTEFVQRCARAGVAITFVPDIPTTGLCGAARWLSSSKALIQLSSQYKANELLFFHEAGHILLHGKRDIFLELDKESGIGEQTEDIRTKEKEADEFASAFRTN